MHKVNNVQDADYDTSLLIDQVTLGGVDYEFYMVHLDGATVTGDATLEAILKPGVAGEYPYIDLLAPDNLGTRTLLDIQGRSLRSMTGVGGVAPTLAEVQEHALENHQHISSRIETSSGNTEWGITSGTYQGGSSVSSSNNRQALTSPVASDGETESANVISTETRVKAIVEGVGYIVVMVAA